MTSKTKGTTVDDITQKMGREKMIQVPTKIRKVKYSRFVNQRFGNDERKTFDKDFEGWEIVRTMMIPEHQKKEYMDSFNPEIDEKEKVVTFTKTRAKRKIDKTIVKKVYVKPIEYKEKEIKEEYNNENFIEDFSKEDSVHCN
jgi:hypothetical protein